MGWPEETPDKVWSDLPGFAAVAGPSEAIPLDLEYLYDPRSFLDMKGKSWAVFRKNVRKFPDRYKGGTEYNWIDFYDLRRDRREEKIGSLLEEWLEDRPDQEIHDSQLMIDYLFRGWRRKVLWNTSSNQLLGINVWDENWKYVNFRFSICRNTPFLSEYMRYLFYTDKTILNPNKLVNDGGVLDNDSLKRFKDKLNPISVRQVNSWKRFS